MNGLEDNYVYMSPLVRLDAQVEKNWLCDPHVNAIRASGTGMNPHLLRSQESTVEYHCRRRLLAHLPRAMQYLRMQLQMERLVYLYSSSSGRIATSSPA